MWLFSPVLEASSFFSVFFGSPGSRHCGLSDRWGLLHSALHPGAHLTAPGQWLPQVLLLGGGGRTCRSVSLTLGQGWCFRWESEDPNRRFADVCFTFSFGFCESQQNESFSFYIVHGLCFFFCFFLWRVFQAAPSKIPNGDVPFGFGLNPRKQTHPRKKPDPYRMIDTYIRIYIYIYLYTHTPVGGLVAPLVHSGSASLADSWRAPVECISHLPGHRGPPAIGALSHGHFLGRFGSPKIGQKRKKVFPKFSPYSRLSTGGPRYAPKCILVPPT